MYAREKQIDELHLYFMKPIQKLIGGVWELYLALGYEIPSLAVERHRSRGGGAPPTFDLILSMQRS